MIDASAFANADGGDGLRSVTAADVALHVGGTLMGDPTVVVRGIAPLDRAQPDELSFFAHARYAAWYAQTRAGVVLVSPALAEASGAPLVRIVVDKPVEAMVALLERFHRRVPRPAGVHATALVAPTATLGANVTVEAYAVIEDHVTIEDGSWIGAHVVVGHGSTLGRDVRVHAGAVLYAFVEVGDRVLIHAGARIGREGFGFLPGPDGLKRIPHVGRCVLEHDVEIGANSCVDRGSVDDTVIGAGTKIDNLVHVAHNVRIGKMCFLISQVGVAGSTRIEDGVQLGGQVGIAGHVTIGARASVGAQGGVISDVPAGETWSGYPARPHKEALRAHAALLRLAKIVRPLEQLLQRERET
ncbi:MAG: UDP-3-O-(3-hydroxymyristoyl)glucosamine N-acyltransferase [Gemmatimonadaceae bacterium]|nr:UDP-3-O-(3-hydroxymyristoyl)glucosamine N-acyltransferase [Gemmatimonadaceae bacterium]